MNRNSSKISTHCNSHSSSSKARRNVKGEKEIRRGDRTLYLSSTSVKNRRSYWDYYHSIGIARNGYIKPNKYGKAVKSKYYNFQRDRVSVKCIDEHKYKKDKDISTDNDNSTAKASGSYVEYKNYENIGVGDKTIEFHGRDFFI
jgi:hypothetical protein